MPFGVVGGVGRGMGVLDRGSDRRREGTALGVNLGRPIVTSGDGDALFPNYFGEDFVFESECDFCFVILLTYLLTFFLVVAAADALIRSLCYKLDEVQPYNCSTSSSSSSSSSSSLWVGAATW